MAGDAAHMHSPDGRAGMNAGLQDAYNLAWKLALVVKGQRRRRTARHLRGEERIPVAQAPAVSTTDRAFQLVVTDSRHRRVAADCKVARARIAALVDAAGSRIQRVRHFASCRRRSGIRYPDSALPSSQSSEGLPDGAPRAGDRFPWLRLKFQSGRPGRGLVAEARRHALQPDRGRAAGAEGLCRDRRAHEHVQCCRRSGERCRADARANSSLRVLSGAPGRLRRSVRNAR